MTDQNLNLDEIFGDFGETNNESPFEEAEQPQPVTPLFEEAVIECIEKWKNTKREEGQRIKNILNTEITRIRELVNQYGNELQNIEVPNEFFEAYRNIITSADTITRQHQVAGSHTSVELLSSTMETLQAEIIGVAQIAKHPHVSYRYERSGSYISNIITIKGFSNDITLEDQSTGTKVHFGEYELTVDIVERNGAVSIALSIRALTPNYPASYIAQNRTDLIHPHILSDSICMGDARHPIENAKRDLRISDIYDVLFALLNTYNPASPYFKLELWDKLRCRNCNNYTTLQNIIKCSVCDSAKCEACGREMVRCSHDGCKMVMCKDHIGSENATITSCHHCGEVFCKRHVNAKRIHPCARLTKEVIAANYMTRLTKIKDGLTKLNGLIPHEENDRIAGQPTAGVSTQTTPTDELDAIFGDFSNSAENIFDELSRDSQPQPVQTEQSQRVIVDEEVQVEEVVVEPEFGNPNPTRGWIRT